MNLDDIKREAKDIEREWEKHRTMNKCSICDSPQGHRTIDSLIDRTAAETIKQVLAVKPEEKKLRHRYDDIEFKSRNHALTQWEKAIKGLEV